MRPWSCLSALLIAFCAFSQTGENELLLKPRALPVPAAPETPGQLRESFKDPPAEYRSMPLWVWNAELDWSRLKEQLAQFQRQGMGGVFVHPRPGLMTKYLSRIIATCLSPASSTAT